MHRLGAGLPRHQGEQRETGDEGAGRPQVASAHAGTARAKTQPRQSTKVRIGHRRQHRELAGHSRQVLMSDRDRHQGRVERRAHELDDDVARRGDGAARGAAEGPGAVEEVAVDRADAPADGAGEGQRGARRASRTEYVASVSAVLTAPTRPKRTSWAITAGTRGRVATSGLIADSAGCRGGSRARPPCAWGSSRSEWMTFGICGIAPSASQAVSTTHARRERARAREGREGQDPPHVPGHRPAQRQDGGEHHEAGGARQPGAPPGHGGGRAHGGQRQHGVRDDAIVGRQPALAGERGEHVGHAQRPDEPVLDARRGQVAAVDAARRRRGPARRRCPHPPGRAGAGGKRGRRRARGGRPTA